MAFRTIEEACEDFIKKVYSVAPGEKQRQQIRLIFYAGASSALKVARNAPDVEALIVDAVKLATDAAIEDLRN